MARPICALKWLVRVEDCASVSRRPSMCVPRSARLTDILLVEFSDVVLSAVGVGVTVPRRGARHYGVVAVVVVVVVVVVVIIIAFVVCYVVAVAVVFFLSCWFFLCSRRRSLSLSSASLSWSLSPLSPSLSSLGTLVSDGCRSLGDSVVLLVWWYRGCETPLVRAVQLAWSSDPVTRPAKGVGGTFCRAEGVRVRARPRRREREEGSEREREERRVIP